MGTGGPLEASFTLVGPINAGPWRLVADGIVLQAVDVRLELLWRSDAGDQTLASWEQSVAPLPEGYNAQPFEATTELERVPAEAGDELVFRYSAIGGNPTFEMAWIPNGEGANADGRIPFIELPP